MSTTPRLNMPLIATAQAQKHVTHNEALVTLDALVHLSVESRAAASPPSSPMADIRYLVPSSPSGAWVGHAGSVAVEDGGSWTYLQPRTGWSAYVRDEAQWIVFDGTAWSPILSPGIGANNGVFQTATTSHVAGNIGSLGLGINDGGGRSGVFVNNRFVSPYSSQDITFLTAEGGVSAATERMRVAKNGHVGIGTSSPLYPLDVRNGGNACALFGYGGTGISIATSWPAVGWNSYYSGTNHLSMGSGYAALAQNNQITGALEFYTSPSVTGVGTVRTFNQILSLSTSGIQASAPLLPSGDNVLSLGSSSFRWSTVYAGTGTINTSDARAKTPVRSLEARELAAARDLRKEIGAFQFLDAVAKKGEGKARIHVGMTVQRAIDVMESHGLDPWRYAMFCRNDITEKKKVKHVKSVQKHRDVEEEYLDVEIRDGQPVQVRKTRTVKEAVFDLRPIVDENGQPVTEALHPVPVMEETEIEVEVEEAAGNRLGFRTDQLLLFMLRGLA